MLLAPAVCCSRYVACAGWPLRRDHHLNRRGGEHRHDGFLRYRGDIRRRGWRRRLENFAQRDACAAEQAPAHRARIEVEQLGDPAEAPHRYRVAEEPCAGAALAIVHLDLPITAGPLRGNVAIEIAERLCEYREP